MLLFLFSLLAFAAAEECPPGAVSQFEKCYLYVNTSMDMMSAERYCMGLGGHLVSLMNAFQNNFVADLGTTTSRARFWIGANRLSSSNWSWTDNTEFKFYNWGEGQPKNQTITNCTSLDYDRYWTKELCDAERPFVCTVAHMTESTTLDPACPGHCSDGYILWHVDCQCYILDNHERNYSASVDFCKSQGGGMVKITSVEQNEFIATLGETEFIENGYPWIGLQCNGRQASNCYWQDQTPVTSFYQNFDPHSMIFPGNGFMHLGPDFSYGRWELGGDDVGLSTFCVKSPIFSSEEQLIKTGNQKQ